MWSPKESRKAMRSRYLRKGRTKGKAEETVRMRESYLGPFLCPMLSGANASRIHSCIRVNEAVPNVLRCPPTPLVTFASGINPGFVYLVRV